MLRKSLGTTTTTTTNTNSSSSNNNNSSGVVDMLRAAATMMQQESSNSDDSEGDEFDGMDGSTMHVSTTTSPAPGNHNNEEYTNNSSSNNIATTTTTSSSTSKKRKRTSSSDAAGGGGSSSSITSSGNNNNNNNGISAEESLQKRRLQIAAASRASRKRRKEEFEQIKNENQQLKAASQLLELQLTDLKKRVAASNNDNAAVVRPQPQVAIASSQSDILTCFPIMSQLRQQLTIEEFSAGVTRFHENHGYQLAFAYESEMNRTPMAVAGFNIGECFWSGKNLYVFDLVTSEAARGKGYGGALMDWLIAHALANNCKMIHLDSGTFRKEAHRFYIKNGFDITDFHFSRKLS
jgi:GNAT superfamily N-acetyltransferase